MELSLVKYIKLHGLDKTISDFKLEHRLYDNKVLLKYNQIESPMDRIEVQEARGIILEKDTWKVMSMAFKKFFNAGEGNAHPIDWDSAYVLQKLDGSLIQLYFDWHKKDWVAATSGTAEAEGDVNGDLNMKFSDLFWKAVKMTTSLDYDEFTDKLDTDFIYVFELCTPYNIIVTPHKESSVILLTIRNQETLKECLYDTIIDVSKYINVPIVKRFNFTDVSIQDLQKTLESMPYVEEGYVVVDKNFNRIKIKNPAYVAVHHLKDKNAGYKVITIVKTNEVEEFIACFPERRDEILKLKDNFDSLRNHLEDIRFMIWQHKPKNISPSERKKFATAVFEITDKLSVKSFTGLYFNLLDNKVSSVEEYLRNYDDKKLFEMLS